MSNNSDLFTKMGNEIKKQRGKPYHIYYGHKNKDRDKRAGECICI